MDHITDTNFQHAHLVVPAITKGAAKEVPPPKSDELINTPRHKYGDVWFVASLLFFCGLFAAMFVTFVIYPAIAVLAG